jgi:hypothetical protein
MLIVHPPPELTAILLPRSITKKYGRKAAKSRQFGGKQQKKESPLPSISNNIKRRGRES